VTKGCRPIDLSLVPKEDQRSARSLNRVLLVGELHDAVFLCLKDKKLTPFAPLLRSLIDTCVRGMWFLKYAKEEEITDSVANLATLERVKSLFVVDDQRMFAFVFQQVKGTRSRVLPRRIASINSW